MISNSTYSIPMRMMSMITDSPNDEINPLAYEHPNGEYHDPEEDWW